MGKSKTILIIDDHPLFREGLKSLIHRDSGFKVAGEAGKGSDGFLMAREIKPDIVLVDISLPDKSGIDLTKDLLEVLPQTRILIVSMHSKIDYITEAFQAGAKGYVLKESAGERLAQALEAVSRGEFFLDSSLSHNVVKRLMEAPSKETKITDRGYGALTAREQQILRMLAEGLTTKVIAASLCLSPKTVENHRANIMDKLDLHSTIELVRYAAKLGLIDVDLWKG